MTEQEARAIGERGAKGWCLSGAVSGRELYRQVRALRSMLLRQSEKTWPTGAAWMIEQECAALEQDFRAAGSLPALRREGKTPRLKLLGQVMAESALPASRKLLCAMMAGIQSVQPLDEKELHLLTGAWKLGLLERLSQAETEMQERHEILSRLGELRAMDTCGLVEELSAVHAVFSKDSVYLAMDEENRGIYRRQLAAMARRQRKSEIELACAMMEESRQNGRHIGFDLFPEPEGSGVWYPWLIGVLTALLTLIIDLRYGSVLWTMLAVLPISQVVINFVNFVLLHTRRPRPILRLELKDGIPEEGRTLSVTTAIVPSGEAADHLADKLERDYLRNRSAGSQAAFGILADLPDSREAPGESAMTPIKRLERRIKALEEKYPGHFYLFFRMPEYCGGEECYRGWERKRGALMALMDRISLRHSNIRILVGEEAWLAGVRYLVTLDSDTRLNMDSLRRLTGAMLHPLNRPEIDMKKKVVVHGHGILQPRMGISLQDGNASVFASLFGGDAGTDIYTSASSELYQDCFDAGSYCGKGIIDVRAAEICLRERFPENRVLSHDLLEGAFLRSGLDSAVEWTDGFPHTAGEYLRRQHRWVRGDWQAAAWMMRRIPTGDGGKGDNPLRFIDRRKLLDGVRRSLVPVAGAAALLCSVCLHQYGGFVIGALVILALSGSCLSAIGELLLHGGRESWQWFHSGVMGSLRRELLLLPVWILLLPAEGWTNLHAIITALWRMGVSHQKLLEWTPSGMDTGKRPFYRKKMYALPCWIWGAAALLSGNSCGWVLGALWLAAPFVVAALDAQRQPKTKLQEEEETFLRRQAALMWGYFRDTITESTNFLPPDNVQHEPNIGMAPRTSPTNIGLGLLSCLAAVDLHLESKKVVLPLISSMIASLEKLEKVHGHPYNWYDIRTMKPLSPEFLSTVDSGNLCASLIAVKQGLLALGEESLAERAGKMAENMDFSFLHDRRRHLFYIGYDTQKGAYTQSRYDILASEASQTSYLAVARNEVPKRHWQTLSRRCVSAGRSCGLVSWSGTMFEYFMPHLLLPAERGTLMGESLAFCAAVQKQWGDRQGMPWGVSESGFFLLDEKQSYRYQAHGVPTLAQNHDSEEERVVAPYASFFALRVMPHEAVKNLKRLRAMGMEGKWGLFEALDLTPERTGGQAAAVKSHMVHHLGMSLLSVDNALNGDIMVRRFLSDVQMDSARELLEEKA